MTKTLLALSGALLFAAPALHAQSHRPEGLARGPFIDRGRHGGDGYRHGHNGRYYYYGGVPYFLPFFGYGFGYPSYYGGFGDAFVGGPYGDYAGAYEGRIADSGRQGGRADEGGSLPEAVQRQLAKKGFYKGTVDGKFGPASRSALSRFQEKNDLKETGRIDEPTLDALGFTDHG